MISLILLAANRGLEIANPGGKCQPGRFAGPAAERRISTQVLEIPRNQRLAKERMIAMMRAAHRRSAGVAQG
jgi:hypothetical protein